MDFATLVKTADSSEKKEKVHRSMWPAVVAGSGGALAGGNLGYLAGGKAANSLYIKEIKDAANAWARGDAAKEALIESTLPELRPQRKPPRWRAMEGIKFVENAAKPAFRRGKAIMALSTLLGASALGSLAAGVAYSGSGKPEEDLDKEALTKTRIVKALFSKTIARKAGGSTLEHGIKRGKKFGGKVALKSGASPTANRAAEILADPGAHKRLIEAAMKAAK